MISKKGKILLIRTVTAIVILVIGIFLFKIISSGRKSPIHKDEGETVRTLAGETIKIVPVRAVIKTYGSVRSEKTVTVSSELTGKIVYTKPDMKNGMIVQKGEVLVKIDRRDYEIALKKSIAAIGVLNASISKQKLSIINAKLIAVTAKKQFALEMKQYQRIEGLVTKKVYASQKIEEAEQNLEISRSKYYTALGTAKNSEVELESLKAQLQSAETEKNEAELSLQRCTIKSPFHGRLRNINVEIGEYTTVGKGLFEVVDDSSLEIPIALSADEAGMILDFTPGKEKDYTHWFKYSEDNPIIIEWDDKSGRFEWKGKIIGVEKFDPDTRMITVLVKPVAPTKKHEGNFPLVTGMFCKVIFTGKEISNALKVPLNSIQLNGCIYIVNKKTDKVKAVKIKVIRYDNYQAIISSKGLNNGDYLVTQPLPTGILNGTKVKIVKALN
ncbi:MAG TPA: HlyD family efflux transporter periplasmic adaptor subunit [Victivallales bacterium]|nr:HlyD family efflux transporter periplasmic adaptor subunit [Victivallales bacterium]